MPPPLQMTTTSHQWQPFPRGNAETEVARAARTMVLRSMTKVLRYWV